MEAMQKRLYLIGIQTFSEIRGIDSYWFGSGMQQINLKNYPERFALSGLPVVKVAVSFDGERRTLGEWKIGTY